MIDKELLRNGSGYVDPTAYKALLEVQKGEPMENRTGELWEVTNNKGYVNECIILADHGKVCTILQLIDEDNGYSDIQVNCRGIKFTDSRKLQYCFDNACTGFIRKLSEQEFEAIMKKVAASLGIKAQVVEVVKEVEIVKETEALPDNLELAKVQAQLEVYKGLYEDLLKGVLRNG